MIPDQELFLWITSLIVGGALLVMLVGIVVEKFTKK